jgi:shikimate kinase
MKKSDSYKNIVLIGLPTAGKSSLGVILAKTLGMNFIDTDIVIQEKTGRLLQEIIDHDGPDLFLAIEERTILSLNCTNTVIATGGSVVYRTRAMEHLKSGGIIVYLQISFEEMSHRLHNITSRGIAIDPGQTLSEMYHQRIPLYEQYADMTVGCSSVSFESVVGQIANITR